METLVALENVTKDYGPVRALEGVSLSMGHGITGLLGPNGAGKTTLIKLLLGLVRITAGSGEVLGYPLRGDARPICARVGYMPEDDCYLAGLSGVEMVQLAARLSGLPSIEALRRAHETLDFSGMEQERYRAVETYSHGMRQQLRFAQAIVHDPQLLILDEPTVGLDPEQREDMLQRIRVLVSRAGKAVLLSTHILPDVQSICDTVIILAKGRVRVVERLEVLRRPASPAYHLRVVEQPDLIAERARREGVEVQTDSDGTLTLVGAGEDLPQRIWDWAREVGAKIRMLTPARNSLEQIFLEAVREEHHADS